MKKLGKIEAQRLRAGMLVQGIGGYNTIVSVARESSRQYPNTVLVTLHTETGRTIKSHWKKTTKITVYAEE